ncbi:Rrf2 family transcriptional regulator [Pyruvatibacter sp.]|uniref:RrF2 family transcriptional regulator n=1 Tax=Pyruvatibacter sp. TaxID=1981328 RepID=UPI003267BCA6
MQISRGVEWAAHAASLLATLPEGTGLRAEALALFHGVPQAYMAKQMQALSKAGLVHTSRGRQGGYRLAKPAEEITLWDITAAIEGKGPAFTCTEIRQNGPCGTKPADCRKMCGIAAAFHTAESAFRTTLEAQTLADLLEEVVADSSAKQLRKTEVWLEAQAVAIG